MKNKILNLCLIFAMVLTITNCSEDPIIFDANGGQTAYSFATQSYDVSIPEEDLVISIPVNVTTISNQDRSVSVVVDTELTTGDAGEYSLGSVTIPAGSHSGTLDVTFDFSSITGEDGDVKDLVFTMNVPDGDASYNDTVTVTYFREIVCNDMNITVVSDIYGTETSFGITTADGDVVIPQFYPFAQNSLTAFTFSQNFPLPDGDYIFTLYDDYGDGQVGVNGATTLVGSYSLTCSIITHASGSGELSNGFFESTPFSVNP